MAISSDKNPASAYDGIACYKTAPGAVPTHDYVSVPFDKTPRQAVRDHDGPEAVFEHLYANEEDAKARKVRDTQ